MGCEDFVAFRIWYFEREKARPRPHDEWVLLEEQWVSIKEQIQKQWWFVQELQKHANADNESRAVCFPLPNECEWWLQVIEIHWW